MAHENNKILIIIQINFTRTRVIEYFIHEPKVCLMQRSLNCTFRWIRELRSWEKKYIDDDGGRIEYEALKNVFMNYPSSFHFIHGSLFMHHPLPPFMNYLSLVMRNAVVICRRFTDGNEKGKLDRKYWAIGSIR